MGKTMRNSSRSSKSTNSAPAIAIADDGSWDLISKSQFVARRSGKTVSVFEALTGWYFVVLAAQLKGVPRAVWGSLVKPVDDDRHYELDTATAAVLRAECAANKKALRKIAQRNKGRHSLLASPEKAVDSFMDPKAYHKLMREAGQAGIADEWKEFRKSDFVQAQLKKKRAAEKLARQNVKQLVKKHLGQKMKTAKAFLVGQDQSAETKAWFAGLGSSIQAVINDYWPAAVIARKKGKIQQQKNAAARQARFVKKWGEGEEGLAAHQVAKSRYEYFQTEEGKVEAAELAAQYHARAELRALKQARAWEREEAAKEREAVKAYNHQQWKEAQQKKGLKKFRLAAAAEARKLAKEVEKLPVDHSSTLPDSLKKAKKVAAYLVTEEAAKKILPTIPVDDSAYLKPAPEKRAFPAPLAVKVPAIKDFKIDIPESAFSGKKAFVKKVLREDPAPVEPESVPLPEDSDESFWEGECPKVKEVAVSITVSPDDVAMLNTAKWAAESFADVATSYNILQENPIHGWKPNGIGMLAAAIKRFSLIRKAHKTNVSFRSWDEAANYGQKSNVVSDEKGESSSNEVIESAKSIKDRLKKLTTDELRSEIVLRGYDDLTLSASKDMFARCAIDHIGSSYPGIKKGRLDFNERVTARFAGIYLPKTLFSYLNRKFDWLEAEWSKFVDGDSLKDLFKKGGCNMPMRCQYCKQLNGKRNDSSELYCAHLGCKFYGHGNSYACVPMGHKKNKCRCGNVVAWGKFQCTACAPFVGSTGEPLEAHNSDRPFFGNRHGVHWVAGKHSNIVQGVRCLHTQEGPAAKATWVSHGPDIKAINSQVFEPLNNYIPIEVPLAGGDVHMASIGSLFTVAKDYDGMIREYVYYSFHYDGNLVSGTPIFQNGKMVSVITQSTRHGKYYCIMTGIPVRYNEYEAGSVDCDYYDAFYLNDKENFPPHTDLHAPGNICESNIVRFCKDGIWRTFLFGYNVNNDLISVTPMADTLYFGRIWHKATKRTWFQTFMIAITTMLTVWVMVTGNAISPSSAPAPSPRSNNNVRVSGGVVSGVYPPDTVVEWVGRNEDKATSVIATIDNLRRKITSRSDLYAKDYLEILNGLRATTPADVKSLYTSDINARLSGLEDISDLVLSANEGQNSIRKMVGATKTNLNNINTVIEDCATAKLISEAWTYLFNAVCEDNIDKIAKLKNAYEEKMVKLEAALKSSGTYMKFVNTLQKEYSNKVQQLNKRVIAGADNNVPLYNVIVENLVSVPNGATQEHLSGGYGILSIYDELVRNNRALTDILHALDKYDNNEGIAIPDEANSFWKVLIAKPSVIRLSGDKVAYLVEKTRSDGAQETCYVMGDQEACISPEGNVYDDDSENMSELEHVLARTNPTATVVTAVSTRAKREDEKPIERKKFEAEVDSQKFHFDVVTSLKLLAILFFTFCGYEFKGVAAGMAIFMLSSMVAVQACNPDLMMIKGYKGEGNEYHAWGSLSVGQCIQYGNSTVYIKGIKVASPYREMFLAPRSVKSSVYTKYGCPLGLENTVCDHNIPCPKVQMVAQKKCVSSFNGAMYKTDCALPGTLWQNVHICLWPVNNVMRVNAMEGDRQLKVEYIIHENGKEVHGTFVSGNEIMTGKKFNILNVAYKGNFGFNYFLSHYVKPAPDANHIIEMLEGNSPSDFCQAESKNGYLKLKDANCIETKVSQKGPDVEVVLKPTKIEQGLAHGWLQEVTSDIIKIDESTQMIKRSIPWFSGHFVFTAEPHVAAEGLCPMEHIPLVEIKKSTTTKYVVNEVKVHIESMHCKVKLWTDKCHIIGPQIMSVGDQGKLLLNIICEYWGKDNLHIEGVNTQTVALENLAVEYNYVFHRIEDYFVRISHESRLKKIAAGALSFMPNAVKGVFGMAGNFIYMATIVVCGVIGLIVGIDVMGSNRTIGSLFILIIGIMCAFLVAKAESCDIILNRSNPVECDEMSVCREVLQLDPFASAVNCHSNFSDYCKFGAPNGYSFVEYFTTIRSDCIVADNITDAVSAAHPGARPMAVIGILSFIGLNSSALWKTLFYTAAVFIAIQNAFEIICIMRKWQRALGSILSFFRSDYEFVATVCDGIISLTLYVMLFPLMGWFAILIVYAGQRPLLFEILRKNAFDGVKVSSTYGHWWLSVMIANVWPKKARHFQEMVPIVRNTHLAAPEEQSSDAPLYNIEVHTVRPIDAEVFLRVVTGCSVEDDDLIRLNLCLRYKGERLFYFSEVFGALVVPAHCLSNIGNDWYVKNDLAVFPAEKAWVVPKLFNNCAVALTYVRNLSVRTERNWQRGDSGFATFIGGVTENTTCIWMHSGVFANDPLRKSIHSAYCVPMDTIELHSGKPKRVFTARLAKPTQAKETAASSSSSDTKSASTSPPRGRSTSRSGSTPKRSASVTSGNTGRKSVSRSSSVSKSRIEVERKTVELSAAEIEERNLGSRLTSKLTKRGNEIIIHNGLTTGRLTKDYKRVETPVVEADSRSNNGPRFTAKERKERRVKKQVRELEQNLIFPGLLNVIKKAKPDFQLEFWTSASLSEEEYSRLRARGEIIKAATMENFLEATFERMPRNEVVSIFDEVNTWAKTTKVGQTLGLINDTQHLAAFNNAIMHQKASSALIAKRELAGIEQKIVELKVESEHGEFVVKSSHRIRSRGGNKELQARAKVKASTLKQLAEQLEFEGTFSVTNESGEHVCYAYLTEEEDIIVPAHSVVVDQPGWHSVRDTLATSKAALESVKTMGDFEGYSDEDFEDLGSVSEPFGIALTSNGLSRLDGPWVKGNSGVAFSFQDNGKDAIIMHVGVDSDGQSIDSLEFDFNLEIADGVMVKVYDADDLSKTPKIYTGPYNSEDPSGKKIALPPIREEEEDSVPGIVDTSKLVLESDDDEEGDSILFSQPADLQAVFQTVLHEESVEAASQAVKDLIQYFGNGEILDSHDEILNSFFADKVFPSLAKGYRDDVPDQSAMFNVLAGLVCDELVNKTSFKDYTKAKNSRLNGATRVLFDRKTFCHFAHKGMSCSSFIGDAQNNSGTCCLEKIIHGMDIVTGLKDLGQTAKAAWMWLLNPRFVTQTKSGGLAWDADNYDSMLKSILSEFCTPDYMRTFSWISDDVVVADNSAVINVSNSLQMTPDAVLYARKLAEDIGTGGSDVHDIRYDCVKKNNETKVIYDRMNSFVKNNRVVQMLRFNQGTVGWGFIEKGVLYSNWHVTCGKTVELTVATDASGHTLSKQTFSGTPTSTVTFESTENQNKENGDLAVYGLPGQDTRLTKAKTGKIYTIIHPEKKQFMTVVCTGDSHSVNNTSGTSSNMVDYFAPIDVSVADKIQVIPFQENMKGWSGLPILDADGNPVGVYGLVRTLKTQTAIGVTDRIESSRPAVHAQQADISVHACDVIKQVVAASSIKKIARISAPTGAGKSTRLVRAMGEQINKRTNKKVFIRVCVPTVFTVDNLFEGMCSMIGTDSSSKGRVNIQRQHGKLKSSDRTNFLKNPDTATITIMYCTYGSYLPMIKPESSEDLLILDEIHTRNSSDVLAVEIALLEAGRFRNTLAMTATSWAANPSNDIYIDFSIGSSKRYAIVDRIIKRYDEVPESEQSLYYKIKGVDGKHYALPRDHCASRGKTLVFMSSINECHQGMKDLVDTGPGVTVMTLTSANRGEGIPEGQVIIFATDIAESGITIPDCDNVIDFRRSMKPVSIFQIDQSDGGRFESSYDLQKLKIDSCSATQRKGRTGRTCEGNYWTCDTEQLQSMVDRPSHAMNVALLELLRNNYIRDLAFKGTHFFNDDVMTSIKLLHPSTLSMLENLRPLSGTVIGDSQEAFAKKRLTPEETQKRFAAKLNTLQCVRYIDPVTWYVMPNIPQSWVEEDRADKLCGGDITNVERTRQCKELALAMAVSDDCYDKLVKASGFIITIPLTMKMDAKDWNHSDDAIREAFRDEAFSGIKYNSMDAFYFGGGATVVVSAAAALLFGQCWSVMYGKKKPSCVYQLEKMVVAKAVRCFEYMNTEKLTGTGTSKASFWITSCQKAVDIAVNTVVETLPENNPFRIWYTTHLCPGVKFNNGYSSIWAEVISKIMSVWDSFKDGLPTDKDSLIQSWFGAGALTTMGTFYDNWCEELTPFGAFLTMVGFGSIAMAICTIPQFIGACVFGGIGYLMAHWMTGPPNTPNKYLQLEMNKRRKNRIFQLEMGGVLGGLITHFLIPLMTNDVSTVVKQTLGTYGSQMTLVAANAGASAGAAATGAILAQKSTTTVVKEKAIDLGGIFTQSTTAQVYDMYIQMRMIWNGEIDMYSVDGISSLLTAYGGASSLLSFDLAALLTVGVAAGVDWLCATGIMSIQETWYRNYGNLKPGESVGSHFIEGSEEEKNRKVAHLKMINTLIHCALGSGLNPMCVIPAVVNVLAKKIYEGQDHVTTSELIKTYQKSVTTHPVALLMSMAWTVWRRLKQVGDVTYNADQGLAGKLLDIKDNLMSAVKEFANGLADLCKKAYGNTRTMRRVFYGGMRLLLRFFKWVLRGITVFTTGLVKGVVDMAVRSVIEQIVPSCWLRWCAKEGPLLKDPPENSDMSMVRFFNLYGLKHLLHMVPTLCDLRIDSDAKCPWEIKNLRDLKLWNLMQRVTMNDDINDMAVILKSLKVDAAYTQGWFSTSHPSEVLKYMVSVLAHQASQTVDLMGDGMLEDQLVNDCIHFSQFWTSSYSCTIIRSKDLRQAFVLLNTEEQGVVFSWKWDIPQALQGLLKGYRTGLVPHQENVCKSFSERVGVDWIHVGSLVVHMNTLGDCGWDSIMHDLAFSQADMTLNKELFFAATNVTLLDFELSKLKTHESRFMCVVRHFDLEENYVFKGLEQTWGWRLGMSEDFPTRNIKSFDRSKGKVITVERLAHYGQNPGLACYAARMIHLDFGIKDLVTWAHLVTGLPAICEVPSISDEGSITICDTFSSFNMKKPFIEVTKCGFILFNEHSGLKKINLKLISMAVNSLRKVDSRKEWHRLLDETRRSREFIFDISKFSILESSYFSCLKRGKKFARDDVISEEHCTWTAGNATYYSVDQLPVGDPSYHWVSEEKLFRMEGNKKIPMSCIEFVSEGHRRFMSISALFSKSIVFSLNVDEVKLHIMPNFQILHEEVIGLMINGFTYNPSDTIALNLERRTWVNLKSLYGDVAVALSNNIYPWTALKTNPEAGVTSDVLRIAENPDWVFTAMNAPNRIDGDHVQFHADRLRDALCKYISSLSEVTDGYHSNVSLLIKERDDEECYNSNLHVGVISDISRVANGRDVISTDSISRCKVRAGAKADNTLDLKIIKDKYSLRTIEIIPAAEPCSQSGSDFLSDLAKTQGLDERKPKTSSKDGTIDIRAIKNSKLAHKLAAAQLKGEGVHVAEGITQRKKNQIQSAVDGVTKTVEKVSALKRALDTGSSGMFSGTIKSIFGANKRVEGQEKVTYNGERSFAQIVVDALIPQTWVNLPNSPPKNVRAELRYMEALEQYQQRLLNGEGSSTTAIAEANFQERVIRSIIDNQSVYADEDIERVLQDNGYVVHFTNVSERGLPSLPSVGTAFASVRTSQEISKTHEQKLREMVSIRKAEVLPQGAPIKPLIRTEKVQHPGIMSMQALQTSLASINHIGQPIYDALAGYNRVYKPKTTELGTVSRGWPKVQLMDRDLGLWSASATVFDMTAGFGGYSEYFTHAPRLKAIVDGQVVSEDGRVKTLVFSNLVLPGHATAVVDHILNHDEMAKGRLRIRRLVTDINDECNGDLRDARLLERARDAAAWCPPELMVFDAGEDNSNLEVECRWQEKEHPMTDALKINSFCNTYSEAVKQYLPLVQQGGSAVVKMFGFGDNIVDLIRGYSKGFKRIVAYKNPSTTLVSREWYLVLLGRDVALDDYVQFIKDKNNVIKTCKPSEVLSSDITELKYYMCRADVDFMVDNKTIQADFDFGNLIMTLRIEWKRAFDRFASWAREMYNPCKRDLQTFGNKDHSLGAGQIIDAHNNVIESRIWESTLEKIRNDDPRITLDNAVKRSGCKRRFCVPKFYTSYTTPSGDWRSVKPGMSAHVADSIIMRRQLAGPDFDRIEAGFSAFGEKFESRIAARVNMLKATVIRNGYKVVAPTGLFQNVAEPFGISFKQLFGKEKHIKNMLLGDMCQQLFGQDELSSVVGHTQCTAQFLHASWKKRLDIAAKEPSKEDADLLKISMEAIKTPECLKIQNGPEDKKFKPWTYEEACLEVHKQGKGGHFDKYIDFGAAIKDPQFRIEVEERIASYMSGMTAPTYQVCRDKRETKAKKNIDAQGHLVLEKPGSEYDPRTPAYKHLSPNDKKRVDADRKAELKAAASIAPRNIRFAEFVQRFADLMMLGPVQKHHAHYEKLYYGSSTGTPLWRLGCVTKGMHDLYAPKEQQEYWEASAAGEDYQYQKWFDQIMSGNTKNLSENVYTRLYDPAFRKGIERKAMKALIASGDFSGFDGTVSKTDLALNYLFYKGIYQEKYHTMLKTRWEHWMWALVITDHGNVIISDGQRSSGDQDTSFGNTMINSIYHYASTALALGISIEEATRPIGEIWFKADFDRNHPKYKRLYLHRITHISDGDDNLHFGTEKDIELFNRNGPPFLERCGKKIRCGTESGYQLSNEYSGLSYCSHSYVRTRIGVVDGKPIGTYARSAFKTDETDLTLQHRVDKRLGLRVEYLPARPIPEIIGKLVFTMKNSTADMCFKRDYGSSRKEEKFGRKNEEAIAITRGKVLSYLLNYAQYSVVRILCMNALAIIGDGSCNIMQLKKRYNVPSSTDCIASAMKGVFGVGTLHEIETINPEIERKGLRVMRANAFLRYGTVHLKNYGAICPTSLDVLHSRSREWIERYSLQHGVFPGYYYWNLANPNAIIEDPYSVRIDDTIWGSVRDGVPNSRLSSGSDSPGPSGPLDSDDGTHGGRAFKTNTRLKGRSKFLSSLWGTILALTLCCGGRDEPKPFQGDGLGATEQALSAQFRDTPEMVRNFDLIVEASADARSLGPAGDLFPGLKQSIKQRASELPDPELMVGRSFFVETAYQRVYVAVTKAKANQIATPEAVRDSLNHIGEMVENAIKAESYKYGNAAGARRGNLLGLFRKGRFGNKSAASALHSTSYSKIKQALFVSVGA
ncbi:polyprotein [carrot flavi-like virus 1]|nr:polyprotein [carrot flavi-like virus 1]